MYVITNRELHTDRNGVKMFGHKPNTDKGPNELRALECTKKPGKKWQVKLIPDKVTGKRRTALIKKLSLSVERNDPVFSSLDVAEKTMSRARRQGKNVVLFVHGYNTNIESALDTALGLEENYNVIPLLYSWPSNGGGFKGLASYPSDKRDAQVSAPAFARVLEKVSYLMNHFTRLALEDLRPELRALANKYDGGSAEYYAERNRRLAEICPVRVTLLAHSMGNYLLKKTMQSSGNNTFTDSFDNIVLASADVNNKDHADWVDGLESRRRTYITINEDDFALTASRIKPGKAQKARLGHYLKQLNSKTARYVDFTDIKGVGNSHSYFAGEALDNERVKTFFDSVLNGKEAETRLDFSPSDGIYRIPGGRELDVIR